MAAIRLRSSSGEVASGKFRRLAENSMDAASAASALASWEKLDTVLGVGVQAEVEVPTEINGLVEAR